MERIVDVAGGQLRVDVLGEQCLRLRFSSTGDWSESGMNRYGILDETRLGNGASELLAEPYCAQANSDGSVQLFRDGAMVGAVTSISNRPEGGFRIVMSLQDSERLYGLGDENRENIQKRGRHATMVLKNVTSYIPIPFIMSTRGWAALLNTTVFHVIDAGAANPNELVFECAKGQADIYLFLAHDMPGLLDVYTRLSGRPAMLPRWAYGFTFVCDEREVRARDVLYEAMEFRRQHIPCDVIGLEPDWMEQHYDFTTKKKWSEKRFHIPFWLQPNGKGTFAGSLHRMGFRLSLWLCCDYDLSEYEERQLAEKNGKPISEEKIGNDPSPDDLIQDPHFALEARMDKQTVPNEPWFQHLRKFVDDGADAFKLDGANCVCFHPDRKWFNGMDDTEMHNLYPLLYNKQMANGFREHTGRRPMVYSAGGYAGIQQYSATWTGDTGGGAKSLTGLMNLAMSGHSNGTCDLNIGEPEGIHGGMLLPWSQLLGWHQYVQPWFQGDEIYDCFKFYAKLRYRLLPYIYDSAWQAHTTGMPIMRALPLMYPDDLEAANICNEFMLGDWLLVADYTNRVYLPAGVWYNYWTKERVDGGRWLEVANSKEWGDGTQPLGGALFVKGGALLPVAPEMQFSSEKALDELAWEVYVAEGHSAYTQYDDDGVTYAFEQGEYATTTVSCDFDGKTLTLLENVQNNGNPALLNGRVNRFKFFGLPENAQVIQKNP